MTREQRFLVLLAGMFALSGAAALIYEIVWFQLLQLIVGSTAISVGVILAAFMGGLCLGRFPGSPDLGFIHFVFWPCWNSGQPS
jgi:predicted membrane-bound spermidine synthase